MSQGASNLKLKLKIFDGCQQFCYNFLRSTRWNNIVDNHACGVLHNIVYACFHQPGTTCAFFTHVSTSYFDSPSLTLSSLLVVYPQLSSLVHVYPRPVSYLLSDHHDHHPSDQHRVSLALFGHRSAKHRNAPDEDNTSHHHCPCSYPDVPDDVADGAAARPDGRVLAHARVPANTLVTLDQNHRYHSHRLLGSSRHTVGGRDR